MKASLNWLKQYIDIPLDWEKTSEVLTEIGLEVEGEEHTQSIEGGLKGLVVGKVLECIKHPGADKLSLTKVDVGGDEPLQIVCGAPNVGTGKKVVVATVGTMLYPAAGDAFKIKKGKIRGEVSEGMLCAEDEIGIGEGHDGIIELPESTAVGTLASDYFKVENDVVYEIGLTPNRSDATCQLGVAKDLAAAIKINYNGDGKVNVPSVANFKVDNHDLKLDVSVENTEACPRYAGVCIKGIKVAASPEWLQNRLRSIGAVPINNIVDITNFILHELGQPLHAFDYDKIQGQKVIVKTLLQGTKFKALSEAEYELRDSDLMICDGTSKGMCIGGVFGGFDSGVTDGTTNIFLEAAHFNAKYIRRSSFFHDLRTDAAKVFEKGSDPNVSVFALKRAAMLIKEICGGEIASEIVDIYPTVIEPVQIEVKYDYVNTMIGVDIPKADVLAILEAMEMEIVNDSDTTFTVAVPTNKADVLRPADIAEEVLRIYGLNKVALPSHLKSALVIGEKPDPFEITNIAADYLASNGFAEMMGLSLTESRYYQEVLPIAEEKLVFINNTSNVHLNIMRPEMLISGLEAILRNQNRQNADVRLFELGRSYQNDGEGGHIENKHLTMFMSGRSEGESWHNDGKATVSYYTMKAFVGNVLSRLGIAGYQETAIADDTYAFGMKYHRGPNTLVEFGKVPAGILKKMGVKNSVFYANFNWQAILKSLRKHKIEFKELNKFPTMRRDLALVIEKSVKFNDIVAIARKTGKKILKDINLFDVFEDEDKLGEGKKSYAVSYVFEDSTKTLKDKEVEKIMNNLIKVYEDKLGAIIRK